MVIQTSKIQEPFVGEKVLMRNVIFCLLFISLVPSDLAAEKIVQTIVLPGFYTEHSCQQQQPSLENGFIIKMLCDEYIKESLLKFQQNIPYKKWSIKQRKGDSAKDIIIKVKSKGMLPSAYCMAKIKISGEIFFKECQYNK